MRFSSIPDFLKFSFATCEVVKNQFVTASVAKRLISSGIAQSPERIPAST